MEMEIKAVITTFDNLPLLKEQVRILKEDDLISEIIVVSNGSVDGTNEWLKSASGLTAIYRNNDGAGPGRNAGIDAAGKYDYLLMLDGGIRPVIGGTRLMLNYLEKHPEVDVVSPEVMVCFTTDEALAHRRVSGEIVDETAFPQSALSGTAYALCRPSAWDGIRFAEAGPFGKPGWGVDDNEMAFKWNVNGIVHHDFQYIDGHERYMIQIYRRASGSFNRLFKETGIWPNQYGSNYEERYVMTTQMYPQFWNPPWNNSRIDVSCVVLGWNEYPMFARAIKALHDDLKDISHEIIFVDNGSDDETKWWLDTFALRHHHGNTALSGGDGEILRRGEELEPVWTGNVIRVDLPQNTGAGHGFNAGFEKARGKYIFYLSGDILPVVGSVSALAKYLDENEDTDYIGINANSSQTDTEDVVFEGYDHLPRLGLGNYAYSYAMVRREVWDAGCRFADQGPFKGAGCGYEESEFANMMYSLGFRGFMFNAPGYYHDIRNFDRSGHTNLDLALDERKKWLSIRWPNISYDIVHHHDQPPERHIRNVAVVFKASNERPGPPGHILLALQKICNARYFEPGKEPSGYDDYIYVDNGDYDFDAYNPVHGGRSIFWAIDMIVPQQAWRPSLEGYVEAAKKFDKVYAAQIESVHYFKEHGIDAMWLPLAANPEYHKPYNEVKEYDCIALWHNCGERIEYADLALKSFHAYVGWVDGLEYSRWLSRSRCGLNLSRSNEVTLRVFEVMAVGIPLITDRVPGLPGLFKEDTHYLGFDTRPEMIRQIEWVLNNPDLAKKMAITARNNVLKHHTYYHRAIKMLGTD
jgi:glycosyltransferase involved in cell wall biosynthesis